MILKKAKLNKKDTDNNTFGSLENVALVTQSFDLYREHRIKKTWTSCSKSWTSMETVRSTSTSSWCW